MIQFSRFDPTYDHLVLPSRGTPQSAGIDICAMEEGYIQPTSIGKVHTGWSMTVPSGFYTKVESRSGLAIHHGIIVVAGVIDRDYTGEVCVLLHNTNEYVFHYEAGDRIAQLVALPYYPGEIEEVQKLPSTDRGAGGFGSTGK